MMFDPPPVRRLGASAPNAAEALKVAAANAMAERAQNLFNFIIGISMYVCLFRVPVFRQPRCTCS